MSWFSNTSQSLPTPEQALPGREQAIALPDAHHLSGRPLAGPYPPGLQVLDLGMGCFWGAERTFWDLPGVVVTLVGYSGGITPNPTYQETTTGRTGHAEVVRVVYDPKLISTEQILKAFFENHDPTQGMRQGNDVGTTYRSAIYTHTDAQLAGARSVRDSYQAALTQAGRGAISTEIVPAGVFYNAEAYHQQYLAKNPGGYCNHRFNGVSCPVGTGVTST